MADDGEQREGVIAGCTSCPILDCGALTLAYRSIGNGERDNTEPWEFTCPRCGFEFTAAGRDLIFRFVPKDWFLAEIHAA